jgi:hypothetical protein
MLPSGGISQCADDTMQNQGPVASIQYRGNARFSPVVNRIPALAVRQ